MISVEKRTHEYRLHDYNEVNETAFENERVLLMAARDSLYILSLSVITNTFLNSPLLAIFYWL